MEIASSTIDAGRRLMEALEESRQPKGEGMVGTGERSSVPPELANEFRALMEAPDNGMHFDLQNPYVMPGSSVGHVQSTQGVQAPTSQRVEGTQSSDSVSMRNPGEPETQAYDLQSPVELLQMQARTGMLIYESKFLSGMRSQATQAMEQQLKSSS